MLINNKQMVFQIEGRTFHCALDVTMNYIGGKWKSVVLWYLLGQTRRFSELKKLIPSITEKMLSLQLKELEADGIVCRTVYPQVPPKVEYALTDFGRELTPIIEAMAKWGRNTGKNRGKLVELGSKKTERKPRPAKA
ncbi:winged helix-turn-helix transcriptional regulator [Adhaeribacter pallidiroseus]|uniref:Putative HTH-type transcriptional regulator n=1 Tax=Adhaeribacter pallidiroseus TaxID=2072847 RepID=A0A369QSM5_9BACT|nr:winged helix-turn-helix transcriptional regulator [Adhaeribacter pallidiroseus]RDC65178.1 putative HTH-type transcriptional regulator [Adhaeribacter pallidiroseus]